MDAPPRDTMAISRFKATCLAALERVRRTGRPLRVTRFGKPIADIVPAVPETPRRRTLGGMAGSMKLVGDVLSPVDVDWEASGR
jgi:antitoxin (DNA-binding transcriptional repressor) of toxin-antitoxin stability system